MKITRRSLMRWLGGVASVAAVGIPVVVKAKAIERPILTINKLHRFWDSTPKSVWIRMIKDARDNKRCINVGRFF